MARIRCPRCGYEAEEGERLRVKGWVEVDGKWRKNVKGIVVWGRKSGFEGIEWDVDPMRDVGSSTDEEAQCTNCGKWSPLDEW